MPPQRKWLTVRRIVTLIATVFACAYVTNGPLLYSRITQRPRLQSVINVLQLPQESFLGFGTNYNTWVSPLVYESAAFIIPRTTDIKSLEAKLASIGMTPYGGGLISGESDLRAVIQDNKLTNSIYVRLVGDVGGALLFSASKTYSSTGTDSVVVLDVRRLNMHYEVRGRDLDGDYVLLIGAIDYPFGKKCLSLVCLLPF